MRIAPFFYTLICINRVFCVNNKGKGGIMSKKKKLKVAKLTDEEYSKYIMALKDEKPPKPVSELQK